MRQIFQIKHFKVFECEDNFIVYNIHKPYHLNQIKGHTHVNSLDTAKTLIFWSLDNRLPSNLSPYMLESLGRISEGEFEQEVWKTLKEKSSKQAKKRYQRNVSQQAEKQNKKKKKPKYKNIPRK